MSDEFYALLGMTRLATIEFGDGVSVEVRSGENLVWIKGGELAGLLLDALAFRRMYPNGRER